jgi:AcrR family transcriptional regulator
MTRRSPQRSSGQAAARQSAPAEPDGEGSKPAAAAGASTNGERRAPRRASGGADGKRGLPRGPQALPREQVAAHQRERLFEAMVDVVNDKGFVASTISDLVKRAGVSRRSFYEHFQNKEECLLAAYDALLERLTERIMSAYRSEAAWQEQIETIVKALFDAASDRPDAAKLVCVEMGAAGPVGIERWAKDAEQLARVITAVFEHAPGEGTVPEPIARAIVGALRTILYARVRRPRSSKALRSELRKLTPDLVSWIAGYYPSPAEIPTRPKAHRHGRLQGGRAPGTFSPSPRWAPRGLPRGEHNLPRGFVAHNQRERIFDAVANLTASGGYPALSLEDVVAEAAVSLQTFYEHFDSKEDAFLATFEMAHSKAMASINRALDLRLSWAHNVRLGVSALLEIIASEPSAAKLACVDILIAYPHMRGRVNEANFSYIELLDIGPADSYPNMPSPVVREAIVGGVFELMHSYILRGDTERLPELVDHVMYLVITPFAGKEIAAGAVVGT